jgi:hypothetical protein
MKKFRFLILISLFFAFNIQAKWLFAGEDYGISYWYDSKIEKNKNIVDVWVLINLPKKNKYGDRSASSKTRIDCNSLSQKTLSNYSYSEPMGQGTLRSSNTLPDKKFSKITKHYGITIAKEVCK